MKEEAKKLIKDEYDFADLTALVALLRSKDGCAWDRAQSHESIRKNLIEECYEAAEGIDKKDAALLCEELGDLLLQVVFHAEISQEEGDFSIGDVINGICRKMIGRHPHIFFDGEAWTKESAGEKWEEIKKKEKSETSLSSELQRVAKTLPSAMRTQKLLRKAVRAGAEEEGSVCTEEELKDRYRALCLDANKNGVDIEELGYRFNEEYIKEKSKDEDR